MNDTQKALETVNTLLSAAVYAITEMQKISLVIQQMQAEGRDKMTDMERAIIVKDRDDALEQLKAAVA
jgi:hypothetical protein